MDVCFSQLSCSPGYWAECRGGAGRPRPHVKHCTPPESQARCQGSHWVARVKLLGLRGQGEQHRPLLSAYSPGLQLLI